MIKRGVYAAKTAITSEEQHGGGIIKHTLFLQIGFYYPNKMVGTYFNSGNNWHKPFIDKKFTYTGEITHLDHEKIEFYIHDPYHNDRILYTGSHTDNQLVLIARRESTPDIIRVQDTFEYIDGTGENGPEQDAIEESTIALPHLKSEPKNSQKSHADYTDEKPYIVLFIAILVVLIFCVYWIFTGPGSSDENINRNGFWRAAINLLKFLF